MHEKNNLIGKCGFYCGSCPTYRLLWFMWKLSLQWNNNKRKGYSIRFKMARMEKTSKRQTT